MGTERPTSPWHVADAVAITGLLCILIALLLTGVSDPVVRWATQDAQDQRAAATRPALRALPHLDALAEYDGEDRRLTITEHLPADALICILKTCGLMREWERIAPEYWKDDYTPGSEAGGGCSSGTKFSCRATRPPGQVRLTK